MYNIFDFFGYKDIFLCVILFVKESWRSLASSKDGTCATDVEGQSTKKNMDIFGKRIVNGPKYRLTRVSTDLVRLI